MAIALAFTAASVQAQWTGSGAGGAGTDFNTTTNWTSGTINGNFTGNTSAATIALSADQSLGANGLTFFTTNTTATTLTINGNGGGANEILTLGGNIIVNRAATTLTAHTINFGSDLTVNLGSSTRQISGQGASGAGGGTINMGALVTGTGGLQLTGSTYGVTLNLTNSGNDFTGAISADRGSLNFTSIADFGVASAMGKGTSGTAITINNTTMAFTGTTDQASNRTFSIGNTSGSLSNNSANNSKLTLSGAIANNVAGGSVGLGGSSTGLSEISSVISDGSFVTNIGKNGAGTWKLSGANTYSGTTTISQGLLEISSIKSVNDTNASSLGKVTTTLNGTITMGGSGGATLRYVGTGDTSDRAFAIGSAGSSSSATLINNGTGALVLSGGITSTNTAQMQQRSFILDGTNTNNNNFSGNISFSFAPTSSVNGANAIITKNGTGLWILGGTSSYSFTQFGGSGNAGTLTTNVNAGTLRINNANAIAGGIGSSGGTSFLNIAGGVLELTTASGDFSRDTGSTATTLNLSSGGFSAFGGNRSVNLGGSSATKTWGVANFLTGGSFILSSSASDSTIDFQNGITLGTTGTNTRTVQVNDGSASVDAVLSGALTSSGGTQSIDKTGLGTLALTNSNTYNGSTTISSGSLQLGNGGTTGSLSTSSAITNNANLTIKRSNAVTQGTDFSGSAITGSGSFTQAGTGTTTLNASNTYSGGTLVSGGTLLISGSGTINNTSGVTINNGGTFRYNNTSTALSRNVSLNTGGVFQYQSNQAYSGSLTWTGGTLKGNNLGSTALGTIGSGMVLAPGNSPGTLSAGTATWANSGTLQLEINNFTGAAGSDPGWDLLSLSGALTITADNTTKFTLDITSLTLSNLAGAASNFVDASNYSLKFATASGGITGFAADKFTVNTTNFSNTFTGTWSVAQTGNDLFLNYTAVPEPSTYAMFAVGLASLYALRRRQRKG